MGVASVGIYDHLDYYDCRMTIKTLEATGLE